MIKQPQLVETARHCANSCERKNAMSHFSSSGATLLRNFPAIEGSGVSACSNPGCYGKEIIPSK